MGFVTSDIVPFSQARANLSELAEQVKAGAAPHACDAPLAALIDAVSPTRQKLKHGGRLPFLLNTAYHMERI